MSTYSLAGYALMIADRIRMSAYEEALRATVTPGCIVLDIGTGLGVSAILAKRLGARRVIAIEPDPVIHVARSIARHNGCEAGIDFRQCVSSEVELDERADVIVSDLRGVLPLFGAHVPSIIDARERLLAPGGVMLPQRDVVYAAVVESAESYADCGESWDGSAYALDFEPARALSTNTWRKHRTGTEALLTEPQRWAQFEYAIISSPHVSSALKWQARRDGIAHGVTAWFDTELVPGIGFSNAPGRAELLYGQALFPFTSPVSLRVGDTVRTELSAKLVGRDYVWSWQTRITSEAGTELANFRQTTLQSMPLDPVHMRKGSASHVPSPSADAEIDQFVLSQMDGVRSVREIAEALCGMAPTQFATLDAATARVSALSQRYSR